MSKVINSTFYKLKFFLLYILIFNPLYSTVPYKGTSYLNLTAKIIKFFIIVDNCNECRYGVI